MVLSMTLSVTANAIPIVVFTAAPVVQICSYLLVPQSTTTDSSEVALRRPFKLFGVLPHYKIINCI